MKKRDKVILIALVFFYILHNAIWISNNDIPIGRDSSSHINNFSDLENLLIYKEKYLFYNPNYNLFFNIIHATSDYPPVYYATALLLKTITLGLYPKIILFTSTIFLILLLFIMYCLSEKIYSGSGILSCVFFSLYPLTYELSRQFNIDLALGTMVIGAIYFLKKTQNFKSLKNSFLLGIVTGVGMLIKQTFFIYLIGPFCVVIFQALSNNLGEDKQGISMLKHVGLFCLIAAAISSLFYGQNVSSMSENLFARMNYLGEVRSLSLLSWQHLFFYFDKLTYALSLPFFLFFLAFCPFFLKINNEEKILLGAWLFVPIFILTLMRLKFTEYLFPCLPAVAILSSIGIRYMKCNMKFKYTLVAGLIIIGLFQFYTSSFMPVFHRSPFLRFLRLDYVHNPKKFFWPKKFTSLRKTLISLVEPENKIGIFQEKADLLSVATLTALLEIYAKNQHISVDFIRNPVVFFDQLNAYDVMIFATDSRDKKWPTIESFFNNLNKTNMFRYYKIYAYDGLNNFFDGRNFKISKASVVNLINRRVHLTYLETSQFRIKESSSLEYVHFYKRRK